MKAIFLPTLCRFGGRLSALALLSAVACSCANTKTPPQARPTASGQGAPAAPNLWVKVSANPPIWYPRGTPADCPTDHWHGDWVYTEDAADTRYFIPRHGLSAERRNVLQHEALAARDMEKIAFRDQADDREIRAAAIKDTIKATPMFLLKAPIYAMAIAGSGL